MIVASIVIIALASIIFALLIENKRLFRQLETLHSVAIRLAPITSLTTWMRQAVFDVRATIIRYKGSVEDQ